jgi:putative spermidine/putrescine transport system substrate-binding protein
MRRSSLGSPGLTRRQALALSGAVSLAPWFGALEAHAAGQLVFASGGGKLEETYKKTVFTPFKEKTANDIVTTANEGAKLKAMVEQGQVEWDMMQGPAELLIVFGRQGLFEPIDYANIDKDSMLPGTVNEFFALTDVAAYNIAWNTANLKGNPPQSWADVWAYDGRIGLWKRPFQTLEVALLADGVALADLYPLDLDRAFKSLDKIKSKIVWWERGAQGAQVFLDGEVDVGAIWNGRVHQPKLDGAPVDFQFNQAIFVNDAWAIPKGAPHKKEAMELLAFALAPEQQAAFARELPYGPVNKAALALLDDKTKATLPSSEENFKKGRLLDLAFWADQSQAVTERFNSWLLA